MSKKIPDESKKDPLEGFKVPRHIKRQIGREKIPEELKILKCLQEQNKEKITVLRGEVIEMFAAMGYKIKAVIVRRAEDNAMIPQMVLVPLTLEEHQTHLKTKKEKESNQKKDA